MPVNWASWSWVRSSLLRAARSMRPGRSASGMGGNASRQGTVSRVSASANPKAYNAVRAASAWATGPTKARVHWSSVGSFFVRTDIDHLDKTLLAVSHVPHRHVGRSAFLEMTVMACTGELAIVGPIAAYWSLPFKLKQEQSEEILHGLGEGWGDLGNLSMQRHGSWHRDTIPIKGIVSRQRAHRRGKHPHAHVDRAVCL